MGYTIYERFGKAVLLVLLFARKCTKLFLPTQCLYEGSKGKDREADESAKNISNT